MRYLMEVYDKSAVHIYAIKSIFLQYFHLLQTKLITYREHHVVLGKLRSKLQEAKDHFVCILSVFFALTNKNSSETLSG